MQMVCSNGQLNVCEVPMHVVMRACMRTQDLGQAVSLGNDRLNITMFAPLNSAFAAPLPAV